MSYVGSDGTYRFVNGGYERWFGIPAGNIVGRHLRDILGEQAWDGIRPHVERALAGETVTFDSLVPYRRAGLRWIRATYTPDVDEGGVVRGFTAVVVDINEQKRAEQKLRESEHRLRLTMEASQTGVWDWDTATGEVRWSPECYAIHGLPPGSFDGTAEAFGRLIHPDDAPRVWAAVSTAAQTASLYECEFRIIRPDGAVRWVVNRGRVLPDPDLGRTRMVGVIADITTRRQAVDALRESEHRLRLSMEASQTGIWDWDLDTGKVHWSPECFVIHGLDPARFDGTDATGIRLLHPDDADRVLSTARAAAASDSLYECEFRIVRPDGAVRWVSNRGRMLPDPTTGRSRMIGTLTDITSRREVVDALRDSEARFRAIAETTPDIVFTTTPEGLVDYANDRHTEFTGQPVEAALGEGWRDAIHPGDRDAAGSRWLESVRTGAMYEAQFRFRTPSGAHRWFAARARPIREPGDNGHPGRITKWVGCCTDIHEAKAAQEVLASMNERLQQAVEAKAAELERSHQALRLSERMASLGTFAAGIAHDLGNLLLPVRTRLDDLLADGTIHAQARQEIDAIQRSTQHIQELCRGLRHFAMDPEADLAGETNLPQWCSQMKPVLRTAVPRSIDLVCHLPDSIPFVPVAPHRLSQALLNLVQNAKDAILAAPHTSERADRLGVIELGAELIRKGGAAGHDVVRLWVRDDGPGMPEQVRARCLEPFFTTKAQSRGGTGLGLSIVQGIASKAGGRVEIQSAPGQGTTFSIFLPASRSCAPDARLPPSGDAPAPRAAVTASDRRIAAFVTLLLAAKGIEVHADSENPDPAAPPDVWITDGTPKAFRTAQILAESARTRIIALGGDDRWRDLGATAVAPGTPMAQLKQTLDAALAGLATAPRS